MTAEEASVMGSGENEFALLLDDDEFVGREFKQAQGSNVISGLCDGEVIREGVGEDVDADDGHASGLAKEMPAVGPEGAVWGAEAVALELGFDHLTEDILISHGQKNAQSAAGGGGEADDEGGGRLAYVSGAFDFFACVDCLWFP